MTKEPATTASALGQNKTRRQPPAGMPALYSAEIEAASTVTCNSRAMLTAMSCCILRTSPTLRS